MTSTEGAGALFNRAGVTQVKYQLEQSDNTPGAMAEGTVFGEAGALRDAFNAGPCVLRLQSGDEAKIMLLDLFDSHGQTAADFRTVASFALKN